MKALTVSQPFASLIADGQKFVENRTWSTSYRGLIAIHAGKGSKYLTKKTLATYPTGCIVAVARPATCVQATTIRFNGEIAKANAKHIAPGTTKFWSELARHEHTEGPWCWVLEDVNKLPATITYRGGAQGLFEIPDEVLHAAMEVARDGQS